MSTQEFLTNVLGFPVRELRPGYLTAQTSRDKFASAIDELVNARGLAAAEEIHDEEEASGLVGIGLALAHVFVSDQRSQTGSFTLHALLHDDTSHTWLMLTTQVLATDPVYPAITRRSMAAHWYERQIFDLFGVEAVGHPDLRALVWPGMPKGEYFPLRKDFQAGVELDFEPEAGPKVIGEGVTELSWGPSQAAISEAVEVRSSLAGERIIALESKLFFAHKGTEKLLEGMTVVTALPVVERVVADAAVAYALAFVQALEGLSGCEPTPRALGLRTLLNELERVTSHIHDLASMGGTGTGYTVLAAHGFRIKERLLRLSEEMFGNRFWRGQIVFGGVTRDLNANELQKIAVVASEAIEEMVDVVTLALYSDGWRDRVETIGLLKREAVLAYGGVGIVARAAGVDRDVRRDHPYAAYKTFAPRVLTKTASDVYARFTLRVDELQESQRLIHDLCKSPGEGRAVVEFKVVDGQGWSATEGARGETVCYVQVKGGVIERMTLRDPSFCNWPLLAELANGNLLSDLPLCQLSLGLSVAGTDL